MGKNKHSRSLTSRKRAKDVSMAMLENVYTRDKMLADAAPRGDFETAMSRSSREIQRAMQLVKDKEAGLSTNPFFYHREDLPRSPSEPHRKKKKRSAADAFGDSSADRGKEPSANPQVQAKVSTDAGPGQQSVSQPRSKAGDTASVGQHANDANRGSRKAGGGRAERGGGGGAGEGEAGVSGDAANTIHALGKALAI